MSGNYDVLEVFLDPVVVTSPQAVFRAACPTCMEAIQVTGPEVTAAHLVNKWASGHDDDAHENRRLSAPISEAPK